MAITISYPKAQAAPPAPKPERAAAKVRKVAASSTRSVGSGSVGNAARQAKWRAQHPEQHRDQMRALRAKKKAGKAAGS
jgi:hypothetical protein